jgi:DNA-binding HxlR family transcriptional regulator
VISMSDDPVIDPTYPARRLLELIGDRWTAIVIFVLSAGTRRYGELQRQLPGISKKMLTQTLRELERGSLVNRKVHAVVPPRVDYDLTDLGLKFVEPATALCRWAQEHEADIRSVEKAKARKPREPEKG